MKLTTKGQELKSVIPQVTLHFEEQVLAGLSEVEQAFLVRLLKQMLQNLEDVSPSTLTEKVALRPLYAYG